MTPRPMMRAILEVASFTAVALGFSLWILHKGISFGRETLREKLQGFFFSLTALLTYQEAPPRGWTALGLHRLVAARQLSCEEARAGDNSLVSLERTGPIHLGGQLERLQAEPGR